MIRLPMSQMATLLDTNVTDLRYTAKRDERVRRALDQGRSKATHNARSTLYRMAVGVQKPDGKYEIQPNLPALKFWLETQEEGFKRESKIELTGANGGSVSLVKTEVKLSREERKIEIERLLKFRDQTEDE